MTEEEKQTANQDIGNEVIIGDVRLVSFNTSIAELVEIAKQLLRDKKVIEYLEELKVRKVNKQDYFT